MAEFQPVTVRTLRHSCINAIDDNSMKYVYLFNKTTHILQQSQIDPESHSLRSVLLDVELQPPAESLGGESASSTSSTLGSVLLLLPLHLQPLGSGGRQSAVQQTHGFHWFVCSRLADTFSFQRDDVRKQRRRPQTEACSLRPVNSQQQLIALHCCHSHPACRETVREMGRWGRWDTEGAAGDVYEFTCRWQFDVSSSLQVTPTLQTELLRNQCRKLLHALRASDRHLNAARTQALIITSTRKQHCAGLMQLTPSSTCPPCFS